MFLRTQGRAWRKNHVKFLQSTVQQECHRKDNLVSAHYTQLKLNRLLQVWQLYKVITNWNNNTRRTATKFIIGKIQFKLVNQYRIFAMAQFEDSKIVKNSYLNIRNLTSVTPVQCSTSWASRSTGSWPWCRCILTRIWWKSVHNVWNSNT